MLHCLLQKHRHFCSSYEHSNNICSGDNDDDGLSSLKFLYDARLTLQQCAQRTSYIEKFI